jgi:hypothetical protein
LSALLVAALTGSVWAGAATSARSRTASDCPRRLAGAHYGRTVRTALFAGTDLWGDKLIARPGGPTYAAANRYLAPLLYASGRRGRPLTTSGVYYLPFSFPYTTRGAHSFALHVADGSQIISRVIGGRSLELYVGDGRELYGSCLASLTPARLAEGYLPIVSTGYVDARGVGYRQESFVGRVSPTRSLVSFVHLTVDTRRSKSGAVVRLVPSVRGLSSDGTRLLRNGATYLLFGDGGAFDGRAVRYAVDAGTVADVYAAWIVEPGRMDSMPADKDTYDAARALVTSHWNAWLAAGGSFVVPERRVVDAERAVLTQQIGLAWRYSVGNSYEQLSFAEAADTAQVMAQYGYGDVTRTILHYSLVRLPERFRDWRAGEQLVSLALYFRLTRDRAFVEESTPALARALRRLELHLRGGEKGLLEREPFSSDISKAVYGLHSQTVVWQGLRDMGRVWAQTGHRELAARARSLASRLGAGLRRAVAASSKRLEDGSLFVPVALLDGGRPFGRLTDSVQGSYWNLVVPYALASGFFPPGGAHAKGVLHYLLGHGSRLLGLVRAHAGLLYDDQRGRLSGTDQVYGVNASRFLADNDRPDQLVLTLYGMLAAAMTPNTFISGEAATVSPLGGTYDRTMYLPPNLGSNAAFLETLRLMLVHEARGRDGAPSGLQLAYATPRHWLGDGKSITVRSAPTSFGPLSYSIARRHNVVHVTVAAPRTPSLKALRLRLRLPTGERIRSVYMGRLRLSFDPATMTITVPRRGGQITFAATVTRSKTARVRR